MINHEIRNLSKVFLDAEVISVSHTGDAIPAGTRPLETLPGVITKLETEGKGAIISQLKKGKTSYLVIVNRDFQREMFLTIEGDKRVKRMLKDGTVVNTDAYISKLAVAPGDICIYLWKS